MHKCFKFFIIVKRIITKIHNNRAIMAKVKRIELGGKEIGGNKPRGHGPVGTVILV